jgi:hypothetical protein
MVQAVGLSITAGTGASPPRTSAGVLQSQLNRYQVQLDDWCNCPSGKTPEGKAKIRDLTDKVDALKAQLKQADATPPQGSVAPVAASSRTISHSNTLDNAGNSDTGTSNATTRHPPSVYSPLGSRLDVFA